MWERVLLQVMKVIANILSLLLLSAPLSAQEVVSGIKGTDSEVQHPATEAAEEEPEYLNGMVPVPSFGADAPADSLHLPTLDNSGRVPNHRWWYHPWAFGGYGWDLHEGLNVSLGLSAFTSFGRNSFSGTAERLAAVYAKPINKKLSFAVGGYLNNINSGIGSYREGGLTAVLDYRFNDRWEAYIYGQKSLVNSSDSRFQRNWLSPYGYMFSPFDNAGDRIGAGLRYHFNESTYLEVQVDWANYPDDFHRNMLRHNQMPGQSEMPK